MEVAQGGILMRKVMFGEMDKGDAQKSVQGGGPEENSGADGG